MAVNHLFLFLLTFRTGFSAEFSVFVKTGDSVQLDIKTQELTKIHVLFWGKNDTSTDIVTYIRAIKKVVKDSYYKDRMDFNAESFSLTLKNMQETDSGLYTAKDSENNIVTYRVTVIDAVDAPVLTVNPNSSSDSCTVNFTCRAHDLMINSSYQNNRCSPEEVTSQINTLSMYCSDGLIICNHSNPVSSKKYRLEIKQHCVDNKETVTSPNHIKLPLIIACIVVVVVVVVLCILVALFIYRRYKGAQEADNTVYAQVEGQEMQKSNSDGHTYDVPERVRDQTQEETGDNRPNTTYCTVGQHQKPAVSIETDHTIYSAVCKLPNKKPPSISSDDA